MIQTTALSNEIPVSTNRESIAIGAADSPVAATGGIVWWRLKNDAVLQRRKRPTVRANDAEKNRLHTARITLFYYYQTQSHRPCESGDYALGNLACSSRSAMHEQSVFSIVCLRHVSSNSSIVNESRTLFCSTVKFTSRCKNISTKKFSTTLKCETTCGLWVESSWRTNLKNINV